MSLADKGGEISKSELFELIVESATDFAIFTVDPDGVATSWNVGAERLFGFTEAEMLGTSADVVFTDEDRRTDVPGKERAQARKEGRAVDERWHRREDGSLLWASGLLMPLRDRDLGFFKIVLDRTDQHRAHARLQENEERFRLLATSIPQLVFLTRHDGERTWGSPQWIEFTGLSLGESLGSGWYDAVHPDDREATLRAWDGGAKRGEYYVEHRIRRKASGEYRWFQTRARPIDPERAAEGEWVGTMTDIHDLRDLKDRQQVLMAELQHRTRNLLAVVQSIASQTIRTGVSPEAFGPVFESRLRALGRVQSLLARVDQAAIDLHTLVDGELAAHADGATETGRIVVDGPRVTLPPSSAQTMALALHELATNAVKYGALAHASGQLSVRWAVLSDDDGQRVAVEWRESGVDMSDGGRPKRRGYGSELIERALPYQLGAKTKLEFRPDGVRCSIVTPISRNEAETAHG